jgi:hypothetical protein
MQDARGLDVTSDDADAVAATDDFAARVLRLDRGVEAILPAAERWPDTPIVQLYAVRPRSGSTARPATLWRTPPRGCTLSKH